MFMEQMVADDLDV